MTTTTAAYRAVFFDLMGRFLPMELDEFMNAYFKALGSFVARKGLDPASFSAGLKAARPRWRKTTGRAPTPRRIGRRSSAMSKGMRRLGARSSMNSTKPSSAISARR